MYLQAWDPYYFSPFGVETKLRSYSMVGARISSPHCSLLFPFCCFKYSFRSFFVNWCLCRGYSFHPHRINLVATNLCHFFCCFFFPFHLLCGKFRSPVQFCGFICRIAYCFIFPKFRLCSDGHRVILETTKFPLPLINVGQLSTELSPANVVYQFSMGRPFSTLEIPTLKRGGGARNGQDRVSVFKTLWKRLLNA